MEFQLTDEAILISIARRMQLSKFCTVIDSLLSSSAALCKEKRHGLTLKLKDVARIFLVRAPIADGGYIFILLPFSDL